MINRSDKHENKCALLKLRPHDALLDDLVLWFELPRQGRHDGDGSLARWSLGKFADPHGKFITFSPCLVPVEKTATACVLR